MCRGFVKEDDQEEIPMVPQRAYLPDGVTNFVTPSGMSQLLEERHALISERDNLAGIGDNENERRIELNFINAKLQLLNNRIASARVVNPEEQPKDEIRFGAVVTLKAEAGNELQIIRIVGVDEADISKGKISFISPVSRMLINKKAGDKVTLKRNGKDNIFVIVGIEYK
jgi:transcription elongation factor GreB